MKTKILILFFILCLFNVAFAQEYEGESTKVRYTQVKYPARLVVENLKFIEPSGNRALDEGETGTIEFDLKNNGRGDGFGISVLLTPLSSSKNLVFTSTTNIPSVASGKTQHLSLSFRAESDVQSLKREFRISITEQNGFDLTPFIFSFETQSFVPPALRMEKMAVDDRAYQEGITEADGNGNSIIEKTEGIVVTCYIQNFGQGDAENVKVKIKVLTDDANLNCPDRDKVFEFSKIEAGDYKPVKFYFLTNARYSRSDIPISLEISEKTGRFGANIPLALKVGQQVENVVSVKVDKIDTKKNVEVKKIEEIEELSDVDKNFPKTSLDGSNTLAIIIGIEQYKNAPSANFADRDAKTFYQYAKNTFNIPESNIFYCINDGATQGEFSKLFGADGWISRRITENVTDVMIFYSGHGAPDPKTQKGFIIPYDGDPNYPSTNVSLDEMFNSLANLKAKNVTVFLDACFSGTGRANDMLVSGTKAQIRINIAALTSKLTVFSSSSGTEYSNAYDKEKHGLFTYFLLKGLQNSKQLTIQQLFDYILENLKKETKILGKTQTPTLQTNEKERIILKK